MIDEFKQTLDKMEWSERVKESLREQRMLCHNEFLEKLKTDKLYKQEIFAIQRIVEFEERKIQRTRDIEFEHQKLLKEQEDIMKNIEHLLKAST